MTTFGKLYNGCRHSHSFTHSFDFRQSRQWTLHSSQSCIRVLSLSVLAIPVSSFRVSNMILAGYPWCFLLWVGSHKTKEDDGSSGCRHSGPQWLPLCMVSVVNLRWGNHWVVAPFHQICLEISRNIFFNVNMPRQIYFKTVCMVVMVGVVEWF